VAMEETYREAHRRKHKLLGTFLALSAWRQGLDCVVLERGQLLPFLDLDRMQDKRVDWVKEDVKHLFPHALNTCDSKSGVYSTLYLSRFPIPLDAHLGSMNDAKRVEALAAGGLKSAIVKIPKEDEIVRLLACVTHGIIDFTHDSRD
jgi:hypothetical protein